VKLTRRDAVAALSVVGASVAGGAVVERSRTDSEGSDSASDGEDDSSASDALDGETLDALTAVAEVVYPSRVDGIREFVETYANGRLTADEDRREGIRTALEDLDDVAREWEDAPFTSLDDETREELMRELAVDTTEPDPEGTIPERVRYYVVNDLLYAFYASPTGSELVGTPNPIGHPGGYHTALSAENRRAEPAETRDPPQSESDPPQSESDPPQSESDPPQSESDPPQSESDPPRFENDPPRFENANHPENGGSDHA
jgi:hypothetical protein